jgi:hypothetical protein
MNCCEHDRHGNYHETAKPLTPLNLLPSVLFGGCPLNALYVEIHTVSWFFLLWYSIAISAKTACLFTKGMGLKSQLLEGWHFITLIFLVDMKPTKSCTLRCEINRKKE